MSISPIDVEFRGPPVHHKHHQQHPKRQDASSYSVREDKISDDKSAPSNKTAFSDGRDSTALPEAANSTAKQNKQPPGHETNVTDGAKDQLKRGSEGSEEGKTKKKRRQKPRVIFNPEDDCKKSSKLSYVDEPDSGSDNTEKSVDKSSKDLKLDDTISEDLKPDSDKSEKSTNPKPSDVGAQHQFADSYQTSEFRPYNPLPHALEEKLFPRPIGPANFFDCPSWPDKTECLDVVENLSSWVKSSRMDIDITQRGHK